MARATRLTLICHGETTASRAGVFPRDEPLVGGALAEAAGLEAPDVVRTALVLSSPALCARQTAEAVRPRYDIDEELADISYGSWSGGSVADIMVADPAGLERWQRDPAFKPPGGESIADLTERVALWLDNRLATGGAVIAVTHRAVCRAMIVSALGAPPEAFWKIDISFLGKVMLTSDGRRWALRSLG